MSALKIALGSLAGACAMQLAIVACGSDPPATRATGVPSPSATGDAEPPPQYMYVPPTSAPGPAPTAVPGPRLESMFTAASDGTKAYWPGAFFDNTLGTRCSPATGTNGISYCVPSGIDVLFTDPTCATAIAPVAPQTAPTDYALLHDGPGPSAGVIAAYRVDPGRPLPAPDALYRRNVDGTCATTPAPDGATFYAAGPAVPVTTMTRLIVGHGS